MLLAIHLTLLSGLLDVCNMCASVCITDGSWGRHSGQFQPGIIMLPTFKCNAGTAQSQVPQHHLEYSDLHLGREALRRLIIDTVWRRPAMLLLPPYEEPELRS